MTLIEGFLAELDREAARTRKAVQAVPAGKADWTPHPKSMPFGRLAGLVATMPSWLSLIIDQDELELQPKPGQQTFTPPEPTPEALTAALDKAVAGARASLNKTNDDYLLTTNWRLLFGGQVQMEQPRYLVIRDTFNHLAHHRGQLTVYLRMNDAPVPAIYGPSADDRTFA